VILLKIGDLFLKEAVIYCIGFKKKESVHYQIPVLEFNHIFHSLKSRPL
jgi:hypothetical protein